MVVMAAVVVSGMEAVEVVAVVPLVVGHLEELRVEPTMVAVKEVAADLVTAV